MLLDFLLLVVVLSSGAYFLYSSYKNTAEVMRASERKQEERMSRAEIQDLIEAELEKQKRQASYEEDEDFEKASNNNIFPRLKAVK
jgi:hypothetical protein